VVRSTWTDLHVTARADEQTVDGIVTKTHAVEIAITLHKYMYAYIHTYTHTYISMNEGEGVVLSSAEQCEGNDHWHEDDVGAIVELFI
jgi:hypothetical protein